MSLNRKSKIFCIGQNKTGTTSLEKALIIHGFKIGDQSTGENLLASYLSRDFNKIMGYCKSAEAFQDIPFSLPFLYVYLDQTFRNSKFILTVRDSADQWYNSITKFHAQMVQAELTIPSYQELENASYCYKGWLRDYMSIYFKDSQQPYDRQVLTNAYNAYNNNVIDYFKNKDNLLVINLSDKSSYYNFTDFIDVKPILDRFPWSNKTQ